MEHETYNMNYDSNWGSRYDRSNTEPNPEADIILLMGAIVFIVFFSILCGMCSYERNDEEMNIELIDKVKKKTTEYQKKEGEICSICLEDFQQKEKIVIIIIIQNVLQNGLKVIIHVHYVVINYNIVVLYIV